MSILNKRYLTFSQAANTLASRPHVSTLHRWRTRGLRGVKLVAAKVGGRRVVEVAELERFIEAVTAAADGRSATGSTSKCRQREIEAAEETLRRAGIAATVDSRAAAFSERMNR